MCNSKISCILITFGVILCILIVYGAGVGTAYGMAKNPGPDGTSIFDVNGTLIVDNFVSKVIPMSFLFFLIYLTSLPLFFVCFVCPIMICIKHQDKKETDNNEPTIDDTIIALESKNSIDIEIDSSTD